MFTTAGVGEAQAGEQKLPSVAVSRSSCQGIGLASGEMESEQQIGLAERFGHN